MPIQPSYPGVYVEEVPSGVRAITGVSTSNTAFVDFFPRGPIDRAVRITSLADFERRFGGLDRRSEASYAIQQYYLNGGQVAWVVRVASPNAAAAETTIPARPQYDYVSGAAGGAALKVAAASPGRWGNRLEVGIDYNETRRRDGQPVEFNLAVREVVDVSGRPRVVRTEIYRNLANVRVTGEGVTNARFVESVINGASELIRVESLGAGLLPQQTGDDVIGAVDKGESTAFRKLGQGGDPPGSDGIEPGSDPWNASAGANAIRGLPEGGTPPLNAGIRLLERIAPDIFNILCIPAAAGLSDAGYQLVVNDAIRFCRDRRAFFILDLPRKVQTIDQVTQWMGANDSLRSDHAAVYFPPLAIPDPLDQNRPRQVAPSGTLAGIYARTDAGRGVWKAPAGTEAVLRGATLAAQLTDLENGGLNPKGINVLRQFPIYGNVAWGGRTLDGADARASEWKYIPVRRTALFIEESLAQGLKWVVFEPNDEPLWAQIRLNAGAFMHNLFRQGAFQGKTPREAYLVKCDHETTTQSDINAGIVNIIVGFAPLKPAEFVIIRIKQLTGQIES